MKNLFLSDRYKTMITNAVKAGLEYVTEHDIKALVLGISGGVDSALTAGIARHVCDIANADGHKVRLIGRCMPIDGNKPDETARAIAVGEQYCHEFAVTNLDDAFLAMMRSIDGDLYHKYVNDKAGLCHDGKVRAGNIKARTRMINLYNLASKNKGMVLSTDNLTELFLGFWTLHGDVGDYGFIQKLWKTEVYGMAKLFGGPIAACVDANPTDGLGVSNSDLDQLLPNYTGGHLEGYRLIDDILIDYIASEQKMFSPDHPVIKRYLATEFKRLNPISVERDYLLWTFA